MNHVEENVSLAPYTTLGVGGKARFFVKAQSLAQLEEVLHWAADKNVSVYVLGDGSNTLISDEGFSGLVIRMEILGITSCDEDPGTGVLVHAGAGVSWNELVNYVTTKDWWGIENLAGIPGTVGAAPVQNIGAYGAEVSDVFVSANVITFPKMEHLSIDTEQAQFSYRDSFFKKNSSFIITDVTFRFSYTKVMHKTYYDLETAGANGVALDTPLNIANAVRDIRTRKIITKENEGTAGSFFKNPIVSQEKYKELSKRISGLQGFPVGENIKISLPWILDNVLHLRGFKKGNVRLSEHHALILVVQLPSTEKEIETFSNLIIKQVKDLIGVTIEKEVCICSSVT